MPCLTRQQLAFSSSCNTQFVPRVLPLFQPQRPPVAAAAAGAAQGDTGASALACGAVRVPALSVVQQQATASSRPSSTESGPQQQQQQQQQQLQQVAPVWQQSPAPRSAQFFARSSAAAWNGKAPRAARTATAAAAAGSSSGTTTTTTASANSVGSSSSGGAMAAAAAAGAALTQVPPAMSTGALERDDYGKFVQFFRQASPYIEGHRARTFVVVIPGACFGRACAWMCAGACSCAGHTRMQLCRHAGPSIRARARARRPAVDNPFDARRRGRAGG
jgi:hypothetical protein